MKRLGTVALVLAGFTAGMMFVYSCGGGSSSHSGSLTWPSPVAATGQSSSYANSDDGALQAGAAWPNPRFTDNVDGTVTDNLTGLVWLQDANCFGTTNWSAALSAANGLTSGSCSLTDGSIAGDWRMPNLREIQSLIHFGHYNPAVPNTDGTGMWTEGDPFLGVQSDYYWSGTTYSSTTSIAWSVHLYMGNVFHDVKTSAYYVWPVRGST
jgi:hypothetical protein